MKSGISSRQINLDRVLFRNHQEHCYEVETIEGTIPPFVQGAYFLNGPARFERNAVRYRNWLDGDGMICALRFADGKVKFENRFVQTNKLRLEEESGTFQFRTFGTAFEDDQLNLGLATASPANVSVFPFAGQLLAFGEQSIPFALNMQTLETIGAFDFHRALNDVSPFSAHPKIDPQSGELVNFGVSFSSSQPQLNYYRFDATGQLSLRHRVPLRRAISLHDFALSTNHASFCLSPYRLDVERLLRKNAPTMDALVWEAGDSELLILDRWTGEERWRLPIDGGYVLHMINSFETEEYLYVDVLEMDGPLYESYQPLPDLFTNAPVGRPARYEVCLKTGAVSRVEISHVATMDFPCISPSDQMRRYQRFWFLAISDEADGQPRFFDQLIACDWDTPDLVEIYSAAPDYILAGEPVFVSKPDEPDAGVIICQEYCLETDACAFIFLDATAIQNGAVARVILKSPFHLGFHASFQPS